MTNIKETIVNECLNVLNREDVKKELKNIMRPLIDMLIKDSIKSQSFLIL